MVRRVSGWVKWGSLGILLFSVCPQAQAQHLGLSADDAKALALGTAELLAGTGKAARAVTYIGLADTVREANEKSETDPVGAYAGIAIDIGSGVASRSMFIGGASALGVAAFCIEPAGWIPCGLAFAALTISTDSLIDSILGKARNAMPGVPRPTPRPVPPVEQACFPWGVDAYLMGTVSNRTFPGPPNFESVANGDEARRVPVLKLQQPICVGAENDPDGLGVVRDVSSLQVAGSDVNSGRISLKGRLAPAETGYHHTAVMLWVDDNDRNASSADVVVPPKPASRWNFWKNSDDLWFATSIPPANNVASSVDLVCLSPSETRLRIGFKARGIRTFMSDEGPEAGIYDVDEKGILDASSDRSLSAFLKFTEQEIREHAPEETLSIAILMNNADPVQLPVTGYSEARDRLSQLCAENPPGPSAPENNASAENTPLLSVDNSLLIALRDSDLQTLKSGSRAALPNWLPCTMQTNDSALCNLGSPPLIASTLTQFNDSVNYSFDAGAKEALLQVIFITRKNPSHIKMIEAIRSILSKYGLDEKERAACTGDFIHKGLKWDERRPLNKRDSGMIVSCNSGYFNYGRYDVFVRIYKDKSF